jgi:sialate O-acetylesterase
MVYFSKRSWVAVLGGVGALLWASLGAAEPALRLPAVFSDHMVLQRDAPVPVWGGAEPGGEVTVAFSGQTQTATADEAGRWRVTLDPMSANPTPNTLTVRSGETRVDVQDVLVGEVWLCSGQSNMQLGLRLAVGGERAIAEADQHPHLRLLLVANHVVPRGEELTGQWAVASAESARRFSAVGYFFGLALQRELDVPVGLISAAWGSTSAAS